MPKPSINTELFAERLSEAMRGSKNNTYTLAEQLSLTPSTISRYANGHMEPKMTTLYAMASILSVDPEWLMGKEGAKKERDERIVKLENLMIVDTREIPVLGTIAAGEPIYAEEQLESYADCGGAPHSDFALRVKGDSMIGARIMDGDIVFIRKQPMVEQGEIAAVLIGSEATLKRFKRYGDTIVLAAENPNYKDIVINLSEGSEVRILGKAVAFQSDVR